MNLGRRVVALRILHGVLTLYFILCLLYLYYAAYTGRVDALLVVSFLSLAIEGFLVFILNTGHCPLIHIQRRIGDDKPFFELFLSPRLARFAIPIFAILSLVAVILLIARHFF